jgi:hypothetical protein
MLTRYKQLIYNILIAINRYLGSEQVTKQVSMLNKMSQTGSK